MGFYSTINSFLLLLHHIHWPTVHLRFSPWAAKNCWGKSPMGQVKASSGSALSSCCISSLFSWTLFQVFLLFTLQIPPSLKGDDFLLHRDNRFHIEMASVSGHGIHICSCNSICCCCCCFTLPITVKELVLLCYKVSSSTVLWIPCSSVFQLVFPNSSSTGSSLYQKVRQNKNPSLDFHLLL